MVGVNSFFRNFLSGSTKMGIRGMAALGVLCGSMLGANADVINTTPAPNSYVMSVDQLKTSNNNIFSTRLGEHTKRIQDDYVTTIHFNGDSLQEIKYVNASEKLKKEFEEIMNCISNVLYVGDQHSCDIRVVFNGADGVKYVSIIQGNKEYKAYRLKDQDGNYGIYDESGTKLSNISLDMPIKYKRVSSKFGTRIHPVKKTVIFHRGVDLAAPSGTPIHSPIEGKIVILATLRGYGKCVMIQHSNGYMTVYGHLSRYEPGMKVGSKVKKGQVFGYVGMTGVATGPHLHFEIRESGKHLDPIRAKLVVKQINNINKSKFNTFKNNINNEIKIFNNVQKHKTITI